MSGQGGGDGPFRPPPWIAHKGQQKGTKMDFNQQARLRDIASEIEAAASVLFYEPTETDQLDFIAQALVDYAAALDHA